MATTNLGRFALPEWSDGSDAYPGREGWMEILKLIEDNAAIVFPSGPKSSRPAAGTFGRFFHVTNEGDPNVGLLYYDGGNGWIALNTVGKGGPGEPLALGTTPASEGASALGARADHTHNLPFATKNNPGAMTVAQATMLADASYIPTANMLAKRGSHGNIQVPATPMDDLDAVAQSWVKAEIGKLPSSARNPYYGTDPANIVWRFNAASSNPGSFDVPKPLYSNQVANKAYLDDQVDTYATGGTLIKRWSTGVGGNVADPDNPQTIANKKYVDSRVSRPEWKENDRPLPYALAEVRRIRGRLFDYKSTEEAPLSMRGTKDVLGAYVDEFHEVMPLLTVASEEDGAPERIEDRELIWPVIAAIQELADLQDILDDRLAKIEERLGL